MKIFSSKKRVAAIGVVTAATLVGGGAAYAYWTAGGTGTGDATTAAGLADLVITGDPANAMFPGDAIQDLDVTVLNQAVNSAYVTSLGAFITTNKSGCDGDDFLINGFSTGTSGSPTPLTWSAGEIAPGGSVLSENTIRFNNKPLANQNVCKDALVTINYVAN